MSLLRDDDTAARAMLAGWEAKAGSGGGAAFGGSPGSPFTDYWRSSRAPTPFELVENFRGAVHALATMNAGAVAAHPIRIYAVTGRGQHRPKSYTIPTKRDSAARARLRFVRECREYASWTRKAEEIDEVTDLPILARFDDPNPAFDRAQLIEYLSLSMDVVGAGYCSVESAGPRYDAVWPLLAQYVLPYRTSAQSLPDGFYYFGQHFDVGDLIWCRGLSMRDPYAFGLSPAQAAFPYVALADQYVGARRSIMDRTVDGSTLVTPDDPEEILGDNEGTRFVEAMAKGLSGPSRGGFRYVPYPVKVTPISAATQGLAELQIDEHALKMAALVFNVPNALVFASDSNRAVADSARREHAERAVLPRQGRIAGAFTRWTRREGERLRGARPNGKPLGWDRLFWAFDNPVSEDRMESAKVWDMKLKAGKNTINEWRSAEGEPPVPWGDEPILPSTMAPLSEASASRSRPDPAAADNPARDEDAEETEEEADDTPGTKGKMAAPFDRDDEARSYLKSAGEAAGLSWPPESDEDRRAWCHAVGEHAAAEMRAHAEDLLAELSPIGDKSYASKGIADALKSFVAKSLKTIRTAALAATLALRGPEELAAEDRTQVSAAVAEQAEYLDGFRTAVLDGSQKPDGSLASRAEMYGRAAWAVAHKVEREKARRDGMTEEKNVMGAAERSCDECPAETAKGWVKLGSLKPVGGRACCSNCRCHLEFR